MAFSPFEEFRKRSKAIFAMLVIVCMLTFVLSSGMSQGADFFDWLTRKVGGSSRKGDKLAEVYGDTLYASDLNSIRAYRRIANDYMQMASRVSNGNLIKQIETDVANKTLNEDISKELEKITKTLAAATNPKFDFGKDRDIDFQLLVALKFSQNPFQAAQAIEATIAKVQKLREGLDATKQDSKEKDIRAINSTLVVLNNIRGDFLKRNQELYFDAVPNRNDRDALEFDLLLKRADKMGIEFPPVAVKKAIELETFGTLKAKDAAEIEKNLRRNHPEMTGEILIDSLSREFRVRAALAATYGLDTRQLMRTAPPVYMTPYEFNQYYKDNQTRINVSMIEVPAESFIANVKDQPTVKELEDLFKAEAREEYNPASEKPGFKESRKVRVEWISPSVDLEIYRKSQPLLQAASVIGTGFNATMIGGGVLIPQALPLVGPALVEKFNYTNVPMIDFRNTAQKEMAEWSSPFMSAATRDTSRTPPVPVGVSARDTSVWNPQTIASLAGYLLGTPSPVKDLTARAVHRHLSETIEIRDRVKGGMPRLLGLASPYAGQVLAIAPSVGALPPMLPLEFYKREFAVELRGALFANLVKKDIAAFKAKLEEIAKKPDAKVEAPKYIAEFVKTRPGLKTGQTKEPLDALSIGKDEALKPLAEVVTIIPGEQSPWERSFFMDTDPKNSLWQARWFPTGVEPANFDTGKPVFVTWRTEDIAPKAFPNYADAPKEVKDKVLAAWKLDKARELAKKEAEAIQGEVKKLSAKYFGDGANNRDAFLNEFRDLAFRRKFKLVEPDIMTALKFEHSPQQQGGGGIWTPYEFTAKDILYPTAELSEKVLDLRKKPLGETVVVSDAPKKDYFVAALWAKAEPPIADFNRIYARSALQNVGRDPMYMDNAHRQIRFRDNTELRDRLKTAAGFREEEKFKELEKKKATDPMQDE